MALADQQDSSPILDDKKSIDLEAALERCRRQAETDKEQHERLTAKAIAMGFSSIEERAIAIEAARERNRESSRKHKERLTAEAIARGFSSLEERKQHDMDEWARREAEYQQRLPEMAAAAGKIVAEYQRDLCAGNKEFIPPSPVLSFSQCDCEGKFLLFSNRARPDSKLFRAFDSMVLPRHSSRIPLLGSSRFLGLRRA